jgi:hypothetical protein
MCLAYSIPNKHKGTHNFLQPSKTPSLYAADSEADELPRIGKICLQTSRKGLVRITLFSALTCSIPSKEGMNIVSVIYEPERINKYINKYINQSSQSGADPVKNMV